MDKQTEFVLRTMEERDVRFVRLADDPGAVFTVRRADATAPLATCAVAAGECAFGLAAE